VDVAAFLLEVVLLQLAVDVVYQVVQVVRALFLLPLLIPQENCINLDALFRRQKTLRLFSEPLNVLLGRDSAALVLTAVDASLDLGADFRPHDKWTQFRRHHHLGEEARFENVKVNFESHGAARYCHRLLLLRQMDQTLEDGYWVIVGTQRFGDRHFFHLFIVCLKIALNFQDLLAQVLQR